MSDARFAGHTPGRYESPVEAAVREAIERGEFDNLTGAGRPLPDHGRDENWWLKTYLEREEGSTSGFLPRPLLLRREVEDLPTLVSRMGSVSAVRSHVADLNRRIADEIRTPTGGPPLAMRPVDADAVVERWRADRADLFAAAEPVAAGPPPRRSFWRRLFTTPGP